MIAVASTIVRSPSTRIGNLPIGQRAANSAPVAGFSGDSTRGVNGVAFSCSAISAFCEYD